MRANPKTSALFDEPTGGHLKISDSYRIEITGCPTDIPPSLKARVILAAITPHLPHSLAQREDVYRELMTLIQAELPPTVCARQIAVPVSVVNNGQDVGTEPDS